jgi:serine/threonine protein kinase
MSHLRSGSVINGTFELIDPIGEGKYGSVWNIRWIKSKRNNKPMVVKIVQNEPIDPLYAGVENEIKCWKMVHNHPNIVRLKQVITFDVYTYIIQEKVCGIDMHDRIKEVSGHDLGMPWDGKFDCIALSDELASRYFTQLISALIYMHSLGVAHCDIKAENIMVDTETDYIKLIDFGFSTTERMSDYFCGTLDYIPPETLACKKHDKFLADIWSCGVLLYEMLTGISPFATPGDIRNVNYRIPDSMSPVARDLVGKILVKEPTQRLSLGDIRKHPFIRQYQ